MPLFLMYCALFYMIQAVIDVIHYCCMQCTDPDPGSDAFLTPGSGIRNMFFPDPGSRIPDPKPILLKA
jgi:hypothetical protein